jgi:uncharacterized membrane protein
MRKFGTVRHRGFYIAAVAGLLAGLAMIPIAAGLAVVTGVNVFFAAYLVLVVTLAGGRLTPEFLRKHADEEDAPAPLILCVMLGAVAVSAGSLFLVLMGGPGTKPLPLILGVASVVLGWLAIHTMWAMHYAFEYYQSAKAGSPKRKKGDPTGGLTFPGSDEPDGTSFLYFSYVIGMTAQTSDTEVCSNAMRRIVTVHGIFSFFFNTVLVAAAVNIVVSLAS